MLYRAALRWIAGTRLEDAVSRAGSVNSEGMHAIIDFLGEHVKSRAEAERCSLEYVKLLNSIRLKRLDASVSIKLTQLGLDIGKSFCKENMERLVSIAGERGICVWIDMEGSEYTQDTLDIYFSLLENHQNIAITLQASLRRTSEDMESVIKSGGRIRLVKGAYKESGRIAFTSTAGVEENYGALMATLFRRCRRFAIATHDSGLISLAIKLSRNRHRKFQFQFLMGLSDEEKSMLLYRGYDVAEYIPYGNKWAGYMRRRITYSRALGIGLKSAVAKC